MIKFDYIKSSRRGKLVCEEAIFEMVRNHFSEANPNASFANKKLKMQGSRKRIPDRNYAIHKNGSFDFGLYEEIRNYLITNNFTGADMTDAFKARQECGLKDFELYDGLSLELYDYQKACITECLTNGRGIIEVGTGGGKSLIQASILENWKRINGSVTALLIVPDLALVTQLVEDFTNYGVTFEFSGWTGEKGMEKQDTDVIICNEGILRSQFADYRELVDVDVVLGDECHKVKKANQITKIINKIKTPNKFGFTGTIPLEKIEKWKILGTFGPAIYVKKSDELRKEEYLTEAEIISVKINHPKTVKGYKNEVDFIISDDERHKVINKLTKNMSKNVLILVNRIEHGENLLKHLIFEDREVYFISGSMAVAERRRIIEKMEEQDNIICVAMSSIFSTGVNVKNLHYIIFAAGGKSFTRIVQSIGRGLRLHSSKLKLFVFDLYDNFKFSMQHHEERVKYYEMEKIKHTEKETTLW